MLTVFNVDQGDSFLLKPEHCVFGAIPLLVDSGYRAKLHCKPLPELMDVMITHSHADHIGGLPQLIQSGKVRRVIIPNYLPEISKINSFLGKYATKKIKPINWNQLNKLPRTLVCDGSTLCKHLLVLNPPRYPSQFDFFGGNSELNLERAFAIFAERGIELPRREITEYETPLAPDNLENGGGEYAELTRQLVHRFFISLAEVLRSISAQNVAYFINRHIELTSNQASVVFKYTSSYGDWLFTGDADEMVFQRLISQNKNVKAKYLKVPHHGSKGNLSLSILKNISPSIAIISHGNRKFRGADSHPHREVVKLLDWCKIASYYTNDVVKNGVTIRTKHVGMVAGEPINFV